MEAEQSSLIENYSKDEMVIRDLVALKGTAQPRDIVRIWIGDLGFRRGGLIGQWGIEEAVELHFFLGLECEDDHCREEEIGEKGMEEI
ncbi:hypothetical protein ACB092_03G230000 [Castanea dentata]